jgi:hypothetical protein
MHRLLRWLSTGKSGPVDESTSSTEVSPALRERVHRLEIALAELEDRHAGTVQQLQRLRGRVTGGLRGGHSSPVGEEVADGDKDALRAYARRTGLLR